MSKLSIFIELWDFMKERKKWLLFPIILFLFIFGALIVLAELLRRIILSAFACVKPRPNKDWFS